MREEGNRDILRHRGLLIRFLASGEVKATARASSVVARPFRDITREFYGSSSESVCPPCKETGTYFLDFEQVRIIESNQHSPFYRSRFRVQLRINVTKGGIFHHFHDRLYSNENTWHGALEERYEALVWRGGEEERGPI